MRSRRALRSPVRASAGGNEEEEGEEEEGETEREGEGMFKTIWCSGRPMAMHWENVGASKYVKFLPNNLPNSKYCSCRFPTG